MCYSEYFIGLAMGGSCMPLYQLASYLLLLIILILSCVALGCICKTRKELTRVQRRMKNKRASSWNRVQEAMKQRSGAKQKPPVGKNGWVWSLITSISIQYIILRHFTNWFLLNTNCFFLLLPVKHWHDVNFFVDCRATTSLVVRFHALLHFNKLLQLHVYAFVYRAKPGDSC